MIDNDIINEIRKKTDIVEVISKYLPLTKRGKNYFGVCPFHDDHSPSMSVSYEKQIYTCFSCGATGNVFTFVADYEHISFIESVKLLGEKLGYTFNNFTKKENNIIDYEIYNLAYKFYQNNLYTEMGKNAIKYLHERKLDDKTIDKFGIGLSISRLSLTEYLLNKKYDINKLIALGISNNNSNDLFVNRIMFPLHDLSGNCVGFSGRIYNTTDSSKYVNTKETEIFKKGNLLFNYHRAKEKLKKNDSIIIMEGQMDVIRASTVDIDNCIATMGTALTKNHVSIIKKMTNNVILCFDGDSAGEDATNAAIKLLENNGLDIKIVRLENNMDPDEYILSNGGELFKNRIDKAINLIEYKMSILKKEKNLNDIKELSSYIDLSLKELANIDDDIIVELTLKKLSMEYNIDYDTLKNKYNSLVKKDKVVNVIIKKSKKYDKYEQAESNLLYYLLKDNNLINKVEKRIGFISNKNKRYLYNEITYYYHKYGIICIADFISYLSNNVELLNTLNEIINLDLKDEYTETEIDDYVLVINEYVKNKKIEELEKQLKEETEPLRQAEILKEIMKVREVKIC